MQQRSFVAHMALTRKVLEKTGDLGAGSEIDTESARQTVG